MMNTIMMMMLSITLMSLVRCNKALAYFQIPNTSSLQTLKLPPLRHSPTQRTLFFCKLSFSYRLKAPTDIGSRLRPPLSFYSRKPVVVLPRSGRELDADATSFQTTSTDELDRHVHDVLKRRNKFRRVMKGVWDFLRTREWSVHMIPLTGPDPNFSY
jgi:hypothetical protein